MGWFFSNAHIRKAGGVSQEAVETVMRRMLEQMGYQRAAQQDADTVLYVFEGEQWFSICSELMHYGGQEDMKQTAAHLSRELGSDALAIACIDSDVVLLNLVNVAEGADAWADVGDGSCWGIQQRGIVGPWKEKVTDLDRFQQLLQDKALSPEEILAQVSPLLGLDSEQGFFCPDMADREARQNLRTCYFKRTVAAEAEELPRLELYLPSLQPVKMGDPNTVSVVVRMAIQNFSKNPVISRRNSDKVLFSFARGRERCDRNGHAVFLRPRVDFATTGSEITGISTSSTKLK